jgi:hypothetical protein
LPYSQSGQWGYLRVRPAGDQSLLPLSGVTPGSKRAEAELPAPQALPVSTR